VQPAPALVQQPQLLAQLAVAKAVVVAGDSISTCACASIIRLNGPRCLMMAGGP
jgi:hypothetical protein